MEEQYYFVRFRHGNKDCLLYGEHNKKFPVCATLEIANELCHVYHWNTELAVDFYPVLMSEEEAKESVGLPFNIVSFFAGTRFFGVPFERKEEV